MLNDKIAGTLNAPYASRPPFLLACPISQNIKVNLCYDAVEHLSSMDACTSLSISKPRKLVNQVGLGTCTENSLNFMYN